MILDLVFPFNIAFGKRKTKNNLLRTMAFEITKPPKNIRKERESASRQIWASLLIWLLFSPLYLDNGGGCGVRGALNIVGEVVFLSSLFSFNYLLVHTLLLVIVLFIFSLSNLKCVTCFFFFISTPYRPDSGQFQTMSVHC
jgi:hypothetical protein